jgi:sphinganine C4-monooxygenase
MADSTASYELPPLPPYALHLRPPLIAPIPDKYLTLILPVVAYWGLSMIFHWIDTRDWFPQHRLHTPAEVLKRNHVSRWEVLRDVMIQQVIQTAFGIGLAWFEPIEYYGKEEHDVAVWAQRIRLAQRALPMVLTAVGVNASALASRLAGSYPTIAGALAGGQYPWLQKVITVRGQTTIVPAFASWELLVAQALYWALIPALQFTVAILVVDTWQYFWHRAMHMNKWLYSKFSAIFEKL